MLLKQLIPYKIQKNNDMNNHIRNFSDIIDKLKEMKIKLVKEFINNISMILLYNISFENFRIIITRRITNFENIENKIIKRS